EETSTGGLRKKLEESSTGGLRQKLGEHSSGNGLRSSNRDGATRGFEPEDASPPSLEPESDSAAPGAAPLRLFGGVAPTARTGVALAGFGTLAVLILALGLATPDDAAAPAAAPGAPAAPVAARPGAIRIKATALPPEARWYLDDQQLDSNPLELSVPVDGAVHTLRAEAPDHQPFVKSLKLEGDVDITISLTHK
ncbi:MAG TPA: hypothetical protein VNN80_24405, partial [Polyangiaceae bacterium]|nr:hypothetical protein [Polyangiaceae bacterium]